MESGAPVWKAAVSGVLLPLVPPAASAVQVGTQEVFQVLLLAGAGLGFAELAEDELVEVAEADAALLDRAAEAGVVVYSGDGLKGYGNLVLIKHPNGYVTAYANNGELDVKRGEQVKRGQVIAKSGDTGNVNSPQLHFELRKGSTPVDPTNYLAGL